jgi:hypothetical protein
MTEAAIQTRPPDAAARKAGYDGPIIKLENIWKSFGRTEVLTVHHRPVRRRQVDAAALHQPPGGDRPGHHQLRGRAGLSLHA